MAGMDRRSWLRVAGSAAAGLAMARHTADAGQPKDGTRSGGPARRPGEEAMRQNAGPHAGSEPGGEERSTPAWATPFCHRLDGLMDDLAGRRGVHGAVCAVASGSGSFRWSAARGIAGPDGTPMTPETPWFAASITKLFISATYMRLVEDGVMTLEDRLVDLLPRELTRGLHVMDGGDRTPQITAEHLLAHASGLPDFIEDYPPRNAPGGDRRSLVELLVEEGDRDWTLEDTTRRVREELRPHFPPQVLGLGRVRIRYSDTGYQLLMAMMEARTGSSFHDLVDSTVLEPLGLVHTWAPGHPRTGTEDLTPAALWSGSEVLSFPRFFRSIVDLNSTCEDLVRFGAAVMGGGLFRNRETWPRMQRWNRFGQPLDRAALRQPGWPIQYGLGVMRFELPRFLTPFRPVPAVVGHTGSTGTWLFHAPDLDLYLVGAVSQLTAGPLPYRFVPRILRAAMEVGVTPG